MRVMILGASGIVGQYMRLFVPAGVTPIWVRRTQDLLHHGCDIENTVEREGFLQAMKPDVILNLAGESSVDVVESDPERYKRINVEVPAKLALWARRHGCRFLQVSTQAVWSGLKPPYPSVPAENGAPVNEYGKQKREAESHVSRILGDSQEGSQILRLTFVIGIRPLDHIGRQNPMERWIEFCASKDAAAPPQVSDRFFSPLLATDAADLIWDEIMCPRSEGPVVQFGIPDAWTRHRLAKLICPGTPECSHDDFSGIAQRPVNTTYSRSRHLRASVRDGIREMVEMAENDRAVELALFFGITYEAAAEKLAQGFGELHNAVTEDFRAHFYGSGNPRPQEDAGLLDWYRTTEAYIWELTAYHVDKGFNYAGTCESIAEGLFNAFGPRKLKILCLGDGIGDLTLALRLKGHDAWYHDLYDSRTAHYAKFRHWRQTGDESFPMLATYDFKPPLIVSDYDAIVSLDYLEHVPNVEAWVKAIFLGLKPGGVFVAQNAFGMGSGPQGAMPMHLACNDRFERDWDPLLNTAGFEQMRPQWYQRPVAEGFDSTVPQATSVSIP